MSAKICVPKAFRKADYVVVADRNLVTYDVMLDELNMDGEPVIFRADETITSSTPITNSTTLAQIQTLIEADATSRGLLS
jgi:hypothetical protein